MVANPLDRYVSARIAIPMLETARRMIECIPIECGDGDGRLNTVCERIQVMLRVEMARQLKAGDKAASALGQGKANG